MGVDVGASAGEGVHILMTNEINNKRALSLRMHLRESPRQPHHFASRHQSHETDRGLSGN
jgi:hypothetical protein